MNEIFQHLWREELLICGHCSQVLIMINTGMLFMFAGLAYTYINLLFKYKMIICY